MGRQTLHRKRKSSLIAVLVPCCLAVVVVLASIGNLSFLLHRRRILSTEASPTCDRATPQLNHTTGKPVWAPGYPGSGSELFRDLIEASTGLEAANVYDKAKEQHISCASSRTITCKTHWPLFHKQHPWRPVRMEQMSSNILVLIRHPMRAIPSYFNFVWEDKNNKGQDHVQQAPEEEWNKWRDREIQNQLMMWKSSILGWLTPESESVLVSDAPHFQPKLFLSLEDMVDQHKGPKVLETALDLLRQEGHPVDTSRAKCTWMEHVVNKPRQKRGKHSYTPTFAEIHRKRMRGMFANMLELAAIQKHPDLIRILQGYLEEMKLDEE